MSDGFKIPGAAPKIIPAGKSSDDMPTLTVNSKNVLKNSEEAHIKALEKQADREVRLAKYEESLKNKSKTVSAGSSKIIDKDKGYKAFMENMKTFLKGDAQVGVFGDKKTAKGTSIAEYATYNEFGGVVKSLKARKWLRMTINKMNLGNILKTKEGYQYMSVTPVAPIVIPERSFMRSTYDEEIEKVRKLMVKYIRQNFLKKLGKGKLKEQSLKVGAAYLTAKIKLKITNADQWAEPNSMITIALKSKKGGLKNKPLINTGALRNSITYKIR